MAARMSQRKWEISFLSFEVLRGWGDNKIIGFYLPS